MLHFRKQDNYALLFMLVLTLHYGTGDWISSRLIAEEHTLSYSFLANVIRRLKKARLVQAREGLHGGYRLVEPPEKTTIGVIVRVTGGMHSEYDRSQPLWELVENAVTSVIDTMTLVDLIKKYAAHNKR